MTHSYVQTRVRVLVGSCLATIMLAGVALADADPVTPAAAPAGQATEAAKKEAKTEPGAAEAVAQEVVITGSRIRSKEIASSSPVLIVNPEKAALAGMTNATEILQTSTVAAGSGQVNNTFTYFVVDGGEGINSLSLRGLGAQRSLVLMNGRRLPPAGVGGTVGPVDLNILPNSLIQRYEILKDGASSIYGSDAVAGVVNVITKTDFTGQNISAHVNQTQHGGADERSVSAQFGESFDKGHLTVAAEFFQQTPLRMGQRDNFACPQDFYYDPATGERADIVDPNTGQYKCFNTYEGVIGTYVPIAYGGSFWGTRVPDANSPGASEGVPGYRFIPYSARSFNDPREQNTTIVSPVQRLTLYAQGEYRPDWAGGFELYSEVLAHRRESSQEQWRQLFPYYSELSPINPFTTALDGIGLIAQPIVLVPFNADQEVGVYRLLAGARRNFGDWAFDAYLSHSHNRGRYGRDVIPADRVDAGTGTNQNTLDYIGICGPTAPAGCVALDLFSPAALFDGQLSPAEQAYYFQHEQGNTDYDQTIVEATLTGDLLKLPAGPLAAAFGVSGRHDRINDVPGEFSRNGNVWASLTAGVTRGNDTVGEIFGELEVPLLKGLPFAEDVRLNLSARYSNYHSVGDATTYKVGLNWALNHTLRIRGTHGTSFRAPALYELYLADQVSFLSQFSVDPCIDWGGTSGPAAKPVVQANCAADGLPPDWGGGGSSAEILTGGGLGRLKPEDSSATTVGIVFTPADIGLSLAIDYWRIKVENQIFSTSSVVSACYNSPLFRDGSGFCDLFTRVLDPNSPDFGTITNIDASYRNIPTEETAGLDFTLFYEHEFNFGKFEADAQATKTQYDRSQLFPGDPVYDYNGLISEPKWVGELQSRFSRGDWTFTWTVNYTGPSSNLGFQDEDGVTDVFYAPGASYKASVPSFVTHDFSVRYKAADWAVTLGVENLMDKDAPIIGNGDAGWSATRLGNYPLGSQYYRGYVGRSAFLNVSRDF